ncbi:RsmB/NOP family class I SAM-dependent RNA methyltransferase [Lichenibacterium minor]|uniref:RsmB/NOP family class I SAM-dependent RNA methyltransferase n=1 Tax=Lichenibacterium minor TaxID=2316528 RepID=A0A4Q2U5G4_9HYPH|nr:RsmB/NOP family class I SAM-dependent RNA methyltransferase [Lichenibacterium minor]RYC31829.1 RsmB/NOP family class I SAM-dependent RNA methyltransferase [Lichenibacterium minor]
MNSGARLSAAIEILDVIEIQRRPAADALKEWGTAHRYAGSKDRAAIGSLVYDSLRVKSSAAHVMGSDATRAVLLGALRELRGMDLDAVAALCTGEGYAPTPLTDGERERYASGSLDGAPDHVRGDYPEWLAGSFAAAFGDGAVEEGRALARRAPVDLRANRLKVDRDKAMRSLAHLRPEAAGHARDGIRIAVGEDGRAPALAAEPAYVKGFVEVQDEGSQVAALLSGAKPGMQVLDLCAGSGGKTLALASMMENKGQIFATDLDGRRLMPIYDRLARAGVRNVQVRAPKGRQTALGDLQGRFDVVFVDAPCTGTGTWRRNPDAKWRLRPGALEERIKEQDEILATAVSCVKPGGRLVYVTCSVLREENEDRLAKLVEAHPGLLPLDAGHMARDAGLPDLAGCASPHGPGLRLTPLRCGTDGFGIATLLVQ